MHALAHSPRTATRRTSRPERVSASIQNMIDGWPTTPALVHGRYMTTLAANPMAIALNPLFAPGINSLRAAFLEPEMREFYRDWDKMTAKAVAYLRSVSAAAVDDPKLAQLIGELSLRSERFRTLWARQDVRQKTSGVSRLLHPQVGPLDLHYEKLALPGAPGQMLVAYHAEPGSPSGERLQMLAHLAAPRRRPSRVPTPARMPPPRPRRHRTGELRAHPPRGGVQPASGAPSRSRTSSALVSWTSSPRSNQRVMPADSRKVRSWLAIRSAPW